jgi:transcriptional regulator
MYGTDTKSQFLELRAKGWSLARIAERLKVAQRTLVDRQDYEEIRTLRAFEIEALQEKLLAPGSRS